MAGTRPQTTIKIPSDLVIGGQDVTASDVVGWIKALRAYKRSFEQVYWMAARYAKSRGEGSAAAIIYGEALERVKGAGFVNIEDEELNR